MAHAAATDAISGRVRMRADAPRCGPHLLQCCHRVPLAAARRIQVSPGHPHVRGPGAERQESGNACVTGLVTRHLVQSEESSDACAQVWCLTVCLYHPLEHHHWPQAVLSIMPT